MVNALGGVRMDIPAPVRDRMTGLDIPTPGCVTLNGDQALAWVRSRHFNYFEAGRWRTDPTGDLGRIDRQQEFIRRLMAEAIRQGALNPLRANRLADAALVNLTFDDDFSVRDGLRLVQAFRPVGADGVEMLALPIRVVGAGLRTTPDTEVVVARLRSDPAGSEEGDGRPAISPRQVRVRVLNGTGASGLAGDTSSALAAVGFAPGGAADAQRFNYTRTEIRYSPASGAKARYLARYMKGIGRLVPDAGLGANLDVVLVVGQDFTGIAERPGPAKKPPAPALTTRTSPPPAAPDPEPADPAAANGAPAEPDC